MIRHQRIGTALLALLALALPVGAQTTRPAERDVTFLSTSDSHYKCNEKEAENASKHASIGHMNEVAGVQWPKELGGGEVGKPRGVVWLGDCIDDGDMKVKDECISEKQYKFFVADVGLDGTDGFLKIPVFEGWGNHDGPPAGKEKNGFSFQANLKKRNEIRKQKGLISNVSENGLHYSWDWDDVHFVQCNIYPADKQRDTVHYAAEWHNPQGSLSFLKADLEKNVGDSGRPVVLMAHMGFDTNWWVKEDWKEFYDAVKKYNVILYLYGHTGTGLREWAPEGEAKKLQCINDGNPGAGFFVINIKGDTLRFGMQVKKWTNENGPDGKPVRKWTGDWEWKLTKSVKLSKPIASATN